MRIFFFDGFTFSDTKSKFNLKIIYLDIKGVNSHYPQVAAAFFMKTDSGLMLWSLSNRALR